MRSMTGYSGRCFTSGGLRALIAIRSLNHRFFDWSYKGAPLGKLEGRLRKMAEKKLRRGRVEASVDLLSFDPGGWDIVINEGLLGKILVALEKASRRVGKAANFSVDNILRIPQVVELRRKPLSSSEMIFLERSFGRALDDLLQERRREGRETARRILRHLVQIERALRRIESRARVEPGLLRDKLKTRLKELSPEEKVEDARLETEAALLAQRADIAEEILRLRSHLETFKRLASRENDESIGKRLDFLSQEMAREVNTINSKSQQIEIIRASLAIKGEIESIRQHVQNIE